MKPSALRGPLFVLAVVVLYAGWSAMNFTCDDAYIAFRYVANHRAGRGWTWNPPPFAPVEGYTSFAWVVLLEAAWAVTGLEPPITSNLLGLACSIGTLALGTALLARLGLRHPTLALGLVLCGTVTNRTFIAWTTSGLETPLFTCVFTWWLYEALTPAPGRGAGAATRLFLAASLLSLVRPDGYLFLAASIPLAATWRAATPFSLGVASPALLVAAHVGWRRVTYGYWLPNTYYAKSSGPWPEAGVRYLASFVLENGVYVWGAVLVAAAALAAMRGARPRREHLPAALAIGAVVAHAAFYIVAMGGDHFEYRVFAHLVLPLYISMAWLAQQVHPSGAWKAASLAAFIGLSWPIAWTEWRLSQAYTTREATTWLVVPVTSSLPAPLRPLGRAWEDLQRWLIPHAIALRVQEHRVLADLLVAALPPREVGAKLGLDAHIVAPLAAVGVVGWVFPDVAIIDLQGLNDRVIARGRTRTQAGMDRRMAHDRLYPPGYYACWRFNGVFVPPVETFTLRVLDDVPRMTDAEIVACDNYVSGATSGR